MSPYGSADDAESAAIARGRPIARGELASTMTARDIAVEAAGAIRALNELTSDGADFADLDDVREVIASLRQMSQELPWLCEQLARMLVVQREDGQITTAPGQDPDFWIAEAVEALAGAGQTADMLAAALAQAGKTAAELRSPSAGRLCEVDLDRDGLAQRLPDRRRGGHPLGAELSRRAIDLAERQGWTDQTSVASACMTLGSALAWQGRLDEADSWLQRAERTVRRELEPMVAMGVQYARGQLELGCGRAADALAAFRAAERLAGPHPLARPLRAWLVHVLVRLGETECAGQVLADLSERARDRGEMRIASAALRLARDDPHTATVALAPVLDGSARVGWRSWLVEAFLLEATARDALGDPAAAGQALEQALDLAEPDRALLWFLMHPAAGLLERHARQRTAHAALVAQILDLLAGSKPPSPVAGPRPLLEPLSKSELRVLRYLPTHLSAPEIASELSVSTSTVRSHLRNLYAKLSVHRRAEAVASAHAAGLLAPSAPRR